MVSVCNFIIFTDEMGIKKRITPLAPVLLGASGYMTEFTAEQKIFAMAKSFVCVGL